MVTNHLASRLFSTTSMFFKGVRKQPPGHTLIVGWDVESVGRILAQASLHTLDFRFRGNDDLVGSSSMQLPSQSAPLPFLSLSRHFR